MLESILVSQLLLWVIVIVLSLVCLALTRQVGVLYERIAPAGALAMNQRLAGGDAAPELPVVALDGRSILVAPKDGKKGGEGKSQLLFFLSPTCPVCKTLLPILKSIRQHEDAWLDIILASDGDDQAFHKAFVQQHALESFSYVVSRVLGVTYGVSKLPYGVLIDEDGIISALGIVNSREHLESLFEAQKLGKPTIQAFLDQEQLVDLDTAPLVNSST